MHSVLRGSGEPELLSLLPQVVACVRVGGVLDQVNRLPLLVTAGDLGNPLLGDDNGVLERGHRCLQKGHDG